MRFLAILWLCAALEEVVSAPPPEVIKDQAIEICRNRGFGVFLSPGGRWCCKCGAGSYVSEICKPNNFREPQSRKCSKCTFDPGDPNNQTYTVKENNLTMCMTSPGANQCTGFMHTHREPGSRTKPSMCVCDDGYHSATYSNDVTKGCHAHSPCYEGFQPSRIGNATVDTHCELCPNGTFSNVVSPKALCVPWQTCGTDEFQYFPGNSTHNIVCLFTRPYVNLTDPTGITQPGPSQGQGFPEWAIGLMCVFVVGVGILLCYLWYKKKGRLPCGIKSRRNTDERAGARHADDERSFPEEQILLNNGVSEVNANGNHTLVEMTSSSVRYDASEVEVVDEQHDNYASPSQTEFIKGHDNHASPSQTAQPQLHPENYADVFGPEELEKLSESDFCDCCINKRLKEANVGSTMLHALESQVSEIVLPYLRQLGLDPTKISDINKDHQGNENEKRYAWIRETVHMLGKRLTPEFLLQKTFDHRVLRDTMFEKFVQDMPVCH